MQIGNKFKKNSGDAIKNVLLEVRDEMEKQSVDPKMMSGFIAVEKLLVSKLSL